VKASSIAGVTYVPDSLKAKPQHARKCGMAVTMPDADPTLIALVGDELRLLLPIAMADGTLHARDRMLIERFAIARARASGREPGATEIAGLVRWAQANMPDTAEAERLAARLYSGGAEAAVALWDAAQSLSEADGIVTAVENVRLSKLKALLRAAEWKGSSGHE
jgi:hypothetical protein